MKKYSYLNSIVADLNGNNFAFGIPPASDIVVGGLFAIKAAEKK